MTHFLDDFHQALASLGQRYSKKDTLVQLMRIRYGVDGGRGATLEEIGLRPEVRLTRERVRQVIRQGRELLPEPFLRKTRHEVDQLLEARGWTSLEDVLLRPYFSRLPEPESLAYWLDDVGYRRWQHQGTLYFYAPDRELADIQEDIRSYRKRTRRARSDARRAGLVSSAIKLPEEVHLAYWRRRQENGEALMNLYGKAIEHALAHPSDVSAPPPASTRRMDVQVGLRLKRDLMDKIRKKAELQHWGTTLFIRQALLAYLPHLD